MPTPDQLTPWQTLQKEERETLTNLFKKEKDRSLNWQFSLGGLHLNLAHTHLDARKLELLCEIARLQNLEEWREKMFAGEAINTTENRAVLHVALRDTNPDTLRPEVAALHEKMEAFTCRVLDGSWKGETGKQITDVVNIGIGGSDLGPRLVSEALKDHSKGPRTHYIANIDPSERCDILEKLNPEETLFVIVSKTFTTEETLFNAKQARKWIADALGEQAAAKHFVAVSTNLKAVQEFGIAEDNIFPMWDWVGGRYSLWSSVGLSLALQLGWDGFKELLHGAQEMDKHFREAELEKNMPVLLALSGIYYRNFASTPALAVLPYAERLRNLPRFLQQLDMESNGKSTSRDGEKTTYETGPIVFGDCGSISQHSFHQWLHQSASPCLCDFIGVRKAHLEQEAQDILNAHRQAQIEALAFGNPEEDNNARRNDGNKPSHSIELETLTPENVGKLLALYEHKVFCQGVIWNINSFDQFGVELGKRLARQRQKSGPSLS